MKYLGYDIMKHRQIGMFYGSACQHSDVGTNCTCRLLVAFYLNPILE